jgi:hypothetical protein
MLVFVGIAGADPSSQQLMDAFHQQALDPAEYANLFKMQPFNTPVRGAKSANFLIGDRLIQSQP